MVPDLLKSFQRSFRENILTIFYFFFYFDNFPSNPLVLAMEFNLDLQVFRDGSYFPGRSENDYLLQL